MGDEDDDFLDDTIEFADGTQYKIDAEAVHPPLDEISTATHRYDGLHEPDPADLATLEAPLAPGESNHDPNRAERFKDDYDRTWAKRPTGDSKNLFNDRLGKLEPYASSKRGIPLSHDHDVPPRHENVIESSTRARRESITSPRLAKSTIPLVSSRPEGSPWGQISQPPSRTDWGSSGGAGSGATPRRPSGDQQGGRQLPPHLMGNSMTVPSSILPHQRRSSQDQPLATRRPSQDPPSHLRQAPPHQSVAPPSTSTSRSPLPLSIVSPTLSNATAPLPSIAVPVIASPVLDVEMMHATTMHAAAERAKQRRQAEEDIRTERAERARKKADELEEKMRLATEAAKEPITILATSRRDSTITVSPAVVIDRSENSWRERQARMDQIIVPLPSSPPIIPVAKSEPTQILARQATSAVPAPAPVPAPTRSVIESSKPFVPATRTPAIAASSVRSTGFPPTPTGPRADIRQPRAQRQPPPHIEMPTAPVDLGAKPVSGTKEISALDDLMSRIKGAMTVLEPTADPVQTISRAESTSPETLIATVRLPRSSSHPFQSDIINSSLEPSRPHRGRVEARKSSRQFDIIPSFINRDHVPLFDASRIERSQSPPPAWKAYVVRLATYPSLRAPNHKALKGFFSTLVPARVSAVHWDPPVLSLYGPRRSISKDDFLFSQSRQSRKTTSAVVRIPNRRSIAATVRLLEAAEVDRMEEMSSLASIERVESEFRRRAGLPALRDHEAAPDVNGATAPSTLDLFDISDRTPVSSLPGTGRGTPTVASDGVGTMDKKSFDGRAEASTRKFMIPKDEVNDVVAVEPISRESLAAPGAQRLLDISLMVRRSFLLCQDIPDVAYHLGNFCIVVSGIGNIAIHRITSSSAHRSELVPSPFFVISASS
jgi:hypothetical protein